MRQGPASALLVAGALLVSGVGLFWRADTGPVGVPYGGSYAYAPLTPADAYGSTLTPTAGGVVTWTTGHLAGIGLAVLGAVVLAAAGGWALGRRSAR
ncbi:hypothetical protein [Geodermatophilus sp. SYSU D00710]